MNVMNDTTKAAETAEPMTWFKELIERIKQVITKILLKFGIKIGM